MEKSDVGSVIKSIRTSRGITASFMARELGYKAVSSYTRIENGESQVTLEQARKIADLLMVDVNEFFNDQNLRDSRMNAERRKTS